MSVPLNNVDREADMPSWRCQPAFKQGSDAKLVQVIARSHGGPRAGPGPTWRFTSLTLVFCPSAWPFYQSSLSTVRTTVQYIGHHIYKLPGIKCEWRL
jgi:hypothetical protein